MYMVRLSIFFEKAGSLILSLLILSLTCVSPAQAQYVVNNGDTVILETQAGTPYTINDTSVVINGLVRIYEINGSGVRTGNGGYLVINSSGGINVGTTGSLNANALIAGGNGGFITLNGNTLTINGLLTANGLGSGRGGIINMIGNTIDIGSVAVLSARAGSATSNGGEIDIDGSGIVTVANGAVLATGGLSNGTSNLIEIAGTGVNINGLLNATGLGTGTGGTVTIVASSNGVFIGNTSQVLAYSSNGNGGAINLDGDVTVEGSVQAHTGANARTGGVITITGTNTENLTVQNGGILYTNGRTGYVGSAGHGGTIDVDTGSVALLNGYVKAEGGWTGGNAGTIDIRSTNGDITVGNGMQVLATGDNNGTILLYATGGAVNLNAGGAVKAMGNQATTLTLNGDGVTVTGLAEAGGWRDGHGGTLNINSLNNTDITISSGGIASARGAQSGATNGGNINLSGSRDVILSGATSGVNTDRPNDAHIRVYGNESAGTLGQGGVITITAGDDFLSNQFVTVNANGTTVPSGSTYTQGVIDITATDTATIDGIYQVGGRASGNGGGGLIDITAGNDITVDSTSVLEASVSNFLGTATGDGGRIDITSTNGDIGITGGSTVIGGVTRGLIDFSSGVTGDGGQLNVTANNGNITFANANLDGSGANDGGVINILASNNVNMDALSAFTTSGISSLTDNRISITGNSVSALGSLTAVSTGGEGGFVQIVNNGSAINGSPAGGIDVSGSTQGGTIHLTGTSVNTAGNYNYGDAHVILEGTSGSVIVDQTLTARELTMDANGSAATANANLGNIGRINGEGSTITITGSSGNITVGDTTSTGNTSITASNGTITLDGGALNSNGTMTLTTNGTDQDITNNGASVRGANGITFTASGDLSGGSGSYTGTIDATADNIDITASSGNITADDMTAQSIGLTASSGSYIQVDGGTLTAQSGDDGGTVSINVSDTINFQGSGGTDIDTSGSSANGGQGGDITLVAGQDINLNGEFDAQGYVDGNGDNGSGGNITITAGDAFTMNSGSRLRLSSIANDTTTNGSTGDGGDVSISGNSITLNNNAGDDSILTNGYENTQNNRQGGDAGNVTLNSTTFIDLNDGGTDGYYFQLRGGDSGRRADGGDGGDINMNYGTTINIERYNSSTGSAGNFWRDGGSGGSNGGVDGADGQLFFNGAAQ